MNRRDWVGVGVAGYVLIGGVLLVGGFIARSYAEWTGQMPAGPMPWMQGSDYVQVFVIAGDLWMATTAAAMAIVASLMAFLVVSERVESS